VGSVFEASAAKPLDSMYAFSAGCRDDVTMKAMLMLLVDVALCGTAMRERVALRRSSFGWQRCGPISILIAPAGHGVQLAFAILDRGSEAGSAPGAHTHCRSRMDPVLAVVILAPHGRQDELEAALFQNPTAHGRGEKAAIARRELADSGHSAPGAATI
jgi:hypothetical protein